MNPATVATFARAARISKTKFIGKRPLSVSAARVGLCWLWRFRIKAKFPRPSHCNEKLACPNQGRFRPEGSGHCVTPLESRPPTLSQVEQIPEVWRGETPPFRRSRTGKERGSHHVSLSPLPTATPLTGASEAGASFAGGADARWAIDTIAVGADGRYGKSASDRPPCPGRGQNG